MNGILLIDKPSGMTSRDVVNQVSRILKTKRIGHTGTLDPMATGVLALCIGNATKICELITNYDKEYIAEVTLGMQTDTLDTDGTVIATDDNVLITKEQIEEVLKSFIGKYDQEVPIYSAIKVDGKKLYEYARQNKEVILPKKMVEIKELILISDLYKEDNKLKFQIKCSVSKGTYIRSLIRDIGIKLNCLTCMSSLRRVKQGIFYIDECYKLDNIASGDYKILQIRDVLGNINEIVVDEQTEQKIMHGSFIDKTFDSDLIKIINQNGDLIAIYQTYDKDNTKAKPYKMII